MSINKVNRQSKDTVFTKSCKEKPESISLREEFFEGMKIPLDLEMKVIYDRNKAGILREYITFCKVFDTQVKAYDLSKTAMEKTIEICKNKKVLEQFLNKREVELMEMMDYLYNDEIIMRNHDAQIARESEARGRNEAKREYSAQLEELKAENARLRAQLKR